MRRLLPALHACGPKPGVAGAAPGKMEVIICATPLEACRAADRIAPEHLSLQVRSPRRLLPRLRNYGSLFLGGGSAVALGDYVTGPNHILPTAGSARTTGGLSVHRFMKVVTVQEVTRAGAARLGPAAARLARLEGLEAHRLSLVLRLPGNAR